MIQIWPITHNYFLFVLIVHKSFISRSVQFMNGKYADHNLLHCSIDRTAFRHNCHVMMFVFFKKKSCKTNITECGSTEYTAVCVAIQAC